MSTNPNPFTLEGKTILITGGAGGIGSATARACLAMGARVVLTDIREDALKSVIESLPAPGCGGENLYFTADLTKPEELDALVAFCPSLDGMVCNAGVMKLTLTQFITEEELQRIQRINLNAPILLTRSILKKKKLGRGGSIVFTASAAGIYRVSIGNAIYATTKCGIDAFMRTVALEFGPKGIRCNSVNPGMVETALIGNFTEEEKERERQNYPLRRFAQPEDIANGIVYLLSDASAFVTGTALKIDGGMTLS
ncbi:MAG: SDR family oxidoreductase [Bacteroidales bacterium]|nr:SDR family oxidoreductase [Bacteroidales bacterium]